MLAAFVGHFVLVVSLYVWLSVLRLQSVSSGCTNYSDYARLDGDQGIALRVQRNLSNQFEAPLFAYIAMAILLQQGAVGGWDVAAAWMFLAGRVVHTAVQTLTENIPLRGAVFSINFVGVMMLVGHVGLLVLAGVLR